MMTKQQDKEQQTGAPAPTPSSAQPTTQSAAPIKADVYNPVNMAGKEAGDVEELQHQPSAKEQEQGEQNGSATTPTSTTGPAQHGADPDQADVYNPVGMAGQKAGIVEKGEQPLDEHA